MPEHEQDLVTKTNPFLVSLIPYRRRQALQQRRFFQQS